LLLSYSLVIFLPNANSFGIIWAGLTLSALSIMFILRPDRTNINTSFFITGLILFLVTIISILINDGLTIKKIQFVKYAFPLFVTSLSINYFRTPDWISSLSKTLKYLSLLLLFFLIFLFKDYNFSISTYLTDPNNLFAERAHIISQLYASVIILYLGTLVVLSSLKGYHFLFLLPLFFMGARSVLLGVLMFSLVFFILSIAIKKIRTFFLVVLTALILLVFLNFDQVIKYIYSSDYVLPRAFIDRGTLVYHRAGDNITDFTSGRNEILEYYINHWELKQIFVGNGMQYLNPDSSFVFRLHNDFFEFFFSFGLLGLFAMLVGIYYKLFYRTINMQEDKRSRNFLIALLIYFITISFTNSILDYQSTLFVYLTIGIFQIRPANE